MPRKMSREELDQYSKHFNFPVDENPPDVTPAPTGRRMNRQELKAYVQQFNLPVYEQPENENEELPSVLTNPIGAAKELYHTAKSAAGMVMPAIRGFQQGATAGHSDEALGMARAALPPYNKPTMDRYIAGRNRERAVDALAYQKSPIAYKTGEAAGSLISPATAYSKATSGARALIEAFKAGARVGSGYSTSDLAQGDLRGYGADVTGGAVLGGGLHSAMGFGQGVYKTLGTRIPEKLANVFLNTPEQITRKYIQEGIKSAKTGQPNPVKTAPLRFELARDFQKHTDKLKDLVKGGSQESRDILTEGNRIYRGADIARVYTKKADELINELEGVNTDPVRIATIDFLKKNAAAFRGGLERIEPGTMQNLPKVISSNRLKTELQILERLTKWDQGSGQFTELDDAVKKEVRHSLDKMLKRKNPRYETHMKNVAKDTELLDQLSDMAKNPKSLPNIFRKLDTDQYGAGQLPKDLIEKMDKRLGTNFIEKATLSNTREAFDKSVTNGSMNVNKFSNMFSASKIPGAKLLAPIIGASVDKYGRKMTELAVDATIILGAAFRDGNIDKFIKMAKPYLDKARQGNISAALTLQLLSKSHPEALQYLNEDNQ